ncbi:MAG: transcription termination factor Rho [Gemmatimonadetes bacterium]|nr:transcription termination factor Rho [Gemmatimonadota bacterium]MDE2679524.1 transcription termination factor Rho [Gemmatimonadota bacterium]MXX35231.1 transcription termination factor Rho [Gemmatimonadota bacterium]MYA11511.1 transcription termination factor Rho [Gemmatimonadota bacterium]MYD13308.1 transcription termination factor Rho [Gemmatimonadota bacterium]
MSDLDSPGSRAEEAGNQPAGMRIGAGQASGAREAVSGPATASDRQDSSGAGAGPPPNRRRGRRGRGRGGPPPHQGGPGGREEGREPGEPLGILEVLASGSGFIRQPHAGYVSSKDDIYVGARLIHRFGLRTGDELAGLVGRRPRNGKSPPLRYLDLVNGQSPASAAQRPDFNRLSAVHPRHQLTLECGRMFAGEPDLTNRVIDLFCPLGKGQRGMIVAPAKAGKTTILQAIAEGVATNHPECELMILLVDERPEEVTEMEACGFGEVISSTFDLTAERHCQVAEMTLERCRRRVETGKHVVIILDSITRLARAHNTIEEGSGRTLSGGLDASSLEKPKRFLGSARLIKEDQGGGSLTIIATALVDTGSRMDQVIFEEFKGTGNSELVLSRELADRRIYPAIDLRASATRKEELLLTPEALRLSRAMRRQLSDQHPAEAMDELQRVMRQTRSNDELIKLALERL